MSISLDMQMLQRLQQYHPMLELIEEFYFGLGHRKAPKSVKALPDA
jgi:hypothetical protein